MQRLFDSSRKAILFLTLAASTLAPASSARAQDPAETTRGADAYEVRQKEQSLEIIEKFSRVVQTDRRISRVDGFDPAIIGVTALAPNKLRVQALMQGVTTMVLVDENDETYSVEVVVSGDARALQSLLDRNFPGAAVQATRIKENVLLTGWVTQPEHITEMVELAELYAPKTINHLRVGGPQRVQLHVKVMEVQRSKLRQMGFNWFFLNRSTAFSSTPGSLVPLANLSTPRGGTPDMTATQTALAGTSAALGVVSNNTIFQGFLDALKQEGLLKIRAEPTLVTTNGQPAKLLNGGEFPILVPQSLGTVTIEWREFGVRLETVPIILSNTRLRQQLIAEVSERDFANAVAVQGVTVPGLTTRRVDTQVEMNFGQTLVIAGLISSRQTAETQKLPFLGELPHVGALFRRVRYDEVETELLVLVTPELAAPLEPGQMPCGPGEGTVAPTDKELYWHGVLEVPNYGDECMNCPLPSIGHPGLLHPGEMLIGPESGETILLPPPGPGMLPPVPGTVEDQLIPTLPPAAPPAEGASLQKPTGLQQAAASTTVSSVVPVTAQYPNEPLQKQSVSPATATPPPAPGLIGPKQGLTKAPTVQDAPAPRMIAPGK